MYHGHKRLDLKCPVLISVTWNSVSSLRRPCSISASVLSPCSMVRVYRCFKEHIASILRVEVSAYLRSLNFEVVYYSETLADYMSYRRNIVITVRTSNLAFQRLQQQSALLVFCLELQRNLAFWGRFVKFEFVPVLNWLTTMPWRHIGEWNYSSIFLDLGIRWRWVVNFTLLPSTSGEWLRGTYWIGDWVIPSVDLWRI
jgi:hypothetical protein